LFQFLPHHLILIFFIWIWLLFFLFMFILFWIIILLHFFIRQRVSKINTSWLSFFRLFYKLIFFQFYILIFDFYGICFHSFFFFALISIELSKYYAYGCKVNELIYVDLNFFIVFVFSILCLNCFWDFFFIVFFSLLSTHSILTSWQCLFRLYLNYRVNRIILS
jgi:hypothetical protein